MEHMGNEERAVSLAEQKRQAGFESVCRELDERLAHDLKEVFESKGHEHELTCVEDCMVAYAQQLRQEIQGLHEDVVKKDDYYEEKATAKLLELFKVYERMVGLYAELRSYYPGAAARVSEHIPSLQECANHAETLWAKQQSK